MFFIHVCLCLYLEFLSCLFFSFTVLYCSMFEGRKTFFDMTPPLHHCNWFIIISLLLLFVPVELQVRWPSSHSSSVAASSTQESASPTGLQWSSHGRPPPKPASSTTSWSSPWHTSSSASTPPWNLYQLPAHAAFPRWSIPLGLWQLPEFPEHTTQHAVSSHSQANSQRQPEQPLSFTHPNQRSTRTSTPQLKPTTPQTPTKDIQKGAASAATARPLIGGKHRQ